VNEHSIENWLRLQPPGTKNKLITEDTIDLRSFNTFSFMIKRNAKPPLEKKFVDMYAALQTIAYNTKDCNMIMCPVISAIRDRLLAVLKPKIVLNTGMSNADVNSLLTKLMGDIPLQCFERIENDFGKFDKSQLELVYWFEYYLYAALGMDEYLLDIYLNSHRTSRLYDRDHGISSRLNWQRRSGGATTWLGNTLFTLCVLLCVYDIDELFMLIVAGDDSLLLKYRQLKSPQNVSDYMTHLFNVECKLLRFKYPYFCSKFLIQTDGMTLLVPDPIKFLTKLGRKDIKNYTHLEEYRISCADNYSVYADENIYDQLSEAVIERYSLPISDLHTFFKTIYLLVSDSESFANLFVPGENQDNIGVTRLDLRRVCMYGLVKMTDGNYLFSLKDVLPVEKSANSSDKSVGNARVIYHPDITVLRRWRDALPADHANVLSITDEIDNVPDTALLLTNRISELGKHNRTLLLKPQKLRGFQCPNTASEVASLYLRSPCEVIELSGDPDTLISFV